MLGDSKKNMRRSKDDCSNNGKISNGSRCCRSNKLSEISKSNSGSKQNRPDSPRRG